MAKQAIEGQRGNIFWREPKSLIILGYDRHRSALADALLQDERPLAPLGALVEIARAWNEGNEDAARSLAAQASGANTAAAAWFLDDARLVLSIGASGVHEPVLVVRDGDDVVVLDGRRRVASARAADKMSREQGGEGVLVPVLIEKGNPGTLAGTMAACNELRRANTPMARAEVAYRIYTQVGGEPAAKLKLIALNMGVTTQTARSWVALGELPPSARTLVTGGLVSQAKAASVARNTKWTLADKVARLESLAERPRPTRPKGPPLKPRVEALVRALRGISAMLPAEAKQALEAFPEFADEETR